MLNLAGRSRWLPVATLLLGAPAAAATYSSDQAPQANEAIAAQHYRLYIPDGIPVVRAVIIHQHGCGRGDWNTGWDLHWRALADKWDAALVAPYLEGDCERWYDPEKGSYRALTDALTAIGKDSKHPEIVDAPLAIWGHSGGADWVSEMMRRHPTRIVAAVARSGGSDPGSAADGVPSLLVRGSDTDIGSDVQKWFDSARKRGALLALARDLDQWHDCADLRVLAIPFLDAAFSLRLPKAGKELLAADASKGYLGNASSFEVAAAAGFAGDAKAANWLPSESVAKKWSEFANPKSPHGTGWATDTTPPETAPSELSSSVQGSKVALAFRALADLETGIKEFRLYRDGALAGMLGGKAGTANVGGGLFQWGQFGDEAGPSPSWPEPNPTWPFPISITQEGAVAGYGLYQLTTVNAEGLEGPKSVAIPVFVGATADTTAPTLSLTAPVALSAPGKKVWSSDLSALALSGTAADDTEVATVLWFNDRGGSGTAVGTRDWTVDKLPLKPGTNVVTVVAYDKANHAATATLEVQTTGTMNATAGGAGGTSTAGGGPNEPGAAGASSGPSGSGGPNGAVGGTASNSSAGEAAVPAGGEASNGCGCRSARGGAPVSPLALLGVLVAFFAARKAERASRRRQPA